MPARTPLFTTAPVVPVSARPIAPAMSSSSLASVKVAPVVAKLAAPVVFPKRMGTAAEFAHLVRALIENDYLNAEIVRFDGGVRFQPK